MSALKGELGDSIEKGREALRRATEQARDWEVLAPEHRRRQEQMDDEVHGEEVGGQRKHVPSDLHPFFRGLLETLPHPGADWPRMEREQWLETARNIFALIYKDAALKPEQTGPVPSIRLVQPEPQAERTESELDQRSA